MSSIRTIFRAMNYYMKPITLLALTLFTCFSSLNAQELKYELSEPIDIPLAGWNKVLICSNGNTLLFHFEPRKGIIVKVFDASHKEITSKKHICELFDINILDRSYLDAITEINGEAVIFATQQVENRETIVKLRINASNGNLIEETKFLQSESFKNSTRAYILKSSASSNYYLVCNAPTNEQHKRNFIIKQYSGEHKLLKEIPIDIDPKEYDRIYFRNASLSNNGSLIVAIQISKENPDKNLPDNYVMLYHLVKDQDQLLQAKVQLPSNFELTSGSITYNPIDYKFHYYISSITTEKNQYNQDLIFNDHYLLTFSDDLSSINFSALEDKKVKQYITEQLDSNQIFIGGLSGLFTNERGQTSAFYNASTYDKNKFGLKHLDGYKANYAITIFNDNGEIWGTALAHSKLKTTAFYPKSFGRTSEGGLTQESFLKTKNNYYVLFNDVENNFNRPFSQSVDSFYNSDNSSAMLYRLNKKREVNKSYVFGQPIANEHMQIIHNSDSYDEQKNLYAALIRHRKGKEVTSKIAWIQLEP
jgi:hypothetical protein